ncbi:hypothetical protein IT575_07325 [bacterium]|nr:hypothetical protein [bacterium]
MIRLSPARTYQLLAFGWPALMLAVLLIFPGRDSQADLELRLRGPLGSLEEAPVAREVARRKTAPGGITMFWEETGQGQFRGEIYIPPQELDDAASGEAGAALLPGDDADTADPDVPADHEDDPLSEALQP